MLFPGWYKRFSCLRLTVFIDILNYSNFPITFSSTVQSSCAILNIAWSRNFIKSEAQSLTMKRSFSQLWCRPTGYKRILHHVDLSASYSKQVLLSASSPFHQIPDNLIWIHNQALWSWYFKTLICLKVSLPCKHLLSKELHNY